MPDRLTLTNIQGQYASTSELNNNFNLIAAEFDNILYLDGTAPNQLRADLDLNNFFIVNIPDPTAVTHAVNKRYGDANYGGAAATNAAASAAAALVSENSAASNATASFNSATDSSNSALQSDNSAIAAALSETNAGFSEAGVAANALIASDAANAASLSESNSNTNATQTASDVLLTNADVVSTNSDVLSTNQDTIDTNADVTASGNSAIAAAASSTSAGDFAAQAGAAAGIIVQYVSITGPVAYAGTPGIASYVFGTVYNLRIISTNTSTVTCSMNLDSIGAVNIVTPNGKIPYLGALKSGMIGQFYYDGTSFVLLNPAEVNDKVSVIGSGGVVIFGVQPIALQAELYNTNGWYNSTTFVYSPLREGYYNFNVNVSVQGTVAGDNLTMYLFKGGFIDRQKTVVARGTEANVTMNYSMFMDGVGDQADVRLSNAQRDTSVFDTDGNENWMTIHRMVD